MGDRRLRARERTWREAGDRFSERAYLRERVRLGTLSEGRFQLARALGAPGLGGPEHPPLGFQAWLEALPFRRRGARLERDFVRVPLAIARAFAPFVSAAGGEAFPALVQAGEQAWARRQSPFARHQRQLNGLHSELYEVRGALAFLQRAFDELRGERKGPEGYEAIARRVLYPSFYSGLEELVEAHFPAGDGRLWALRLAVRDALLPWVLEFVSTV